MMKAFLFAIVFLVGSQATPTLDWSRPGNLDVYKICKAEIQEFCTPRRSVNHLQLAGGPASLDEILQQFLMPFPLMLVPPEGVHFMVSVEENPIISHIEEMIRQISTIEDSFNEMNDMHRIIQVLHESGHQLIIEHGSHPVIHHVGRRLQAISQDELCSVQRQCLEQAFFQQRVGPDCHIAMAKLVEPPPKSPCFFLTWSFAAWVVVVIGLVVLCGDSRKEKEEDDSYVDFEYMDMDEIPKLTRRTVLSPKVAYEGIPIQVV